MYAREKSLYVRMACATSTFNPTTTYVCVCVRVIITSIDGSRDESAKTTMTTRWNQVQVVLQPFRGTLCAFRFASRKRVSRDEIVPPKPEAKNAGGEAKGSGTLCTSKIQVVTIGLGTVRKGQQFYFRAIAGQAKNSSSILSVRRQTFYLFCVCSNIREGKVRMLRKLCQRG